MKSTLFLIAFIMVLANGTVFAKNEANGQQGSNQGTQTANGGSSTSTEPLENAVLNNNQVKTQNQGEETMLQVSTQEKEDLGSLVSKKVEELLDDESLEKGIGQEVKLYVQEQKQIQDKVQESINTAEKRNDLVKGLIGPDYKSLKNAKGQLEQNQIKIKQLEELKLKLTNQNDLTMVTETIEALVNQNTALQDQINLEENQKSLLGWLFKLFIK